MAASALVSVPVPAPGTTRAATAAPAAEHLVPAGIIGANPSQRTIVTSSHLADPSPNVLNQNKHRPVEMERGSSSGSTSSSDGRSSPRLKKQNHFPEILGPLKKLLLSKNPSTSANHSRANSSTPPPTRNTSALDLNSLNKGLPHEPSAGRPSVPVRASTIAGSTPCTLKEKYGKPCQLLGKGANGVCYLVRRQSDHKVFCVKEFRRKKDTETQREYVKKLTNEYCIGTLLHHPNVVETHDIIFEKGHCYEIMELCEGGDLFEAISSQSLSQEESDCVFAQLIHGVAYLHSTGVCHRDLKPENCLFDDKNHLKIIDFGSADVVKSPFETQCRKSSGRCGSGPYMAPEEFTEQSYDGRKVDVWACAIIYLAMMFQRFPWQSAVASDANYTDYVASGCKTKFFDRLPEGPRRVLKMMLEPNPDNRCTIEQCLEDAWVKKILMCGDCKDKHRHGKCKIKK